MPTTIHLLIVEQCETLLSNQCLRTDPSTFQERTTECHKKTTLSNTAQEMHRHHFDSTNMENAKHFPFQLHIQDKTIKIRFLISNDRVRLFSLDFHMPNHRRVDILAPSKTFFALPKTFYNKTMEKNTEKSLLFTRLNTHNHRQNPPDNWSRCDRGDW